ncbi:nucleotidyltransferase family protein [Micromonospora sediminicola]|uniref:nucleotidyltransferase family protein n=1 Tax=Micromonospora sediminicola TaxID=946078 RepID=UPI0033A1D33E
MAPLRTVADAVATWPEYATAVAVRLDAHDQITVCAPHGLDDLLDGVWRRNPARVSAEISRRRLSRHRPTER